MTALDVGLRS